MGEFHISNAARNMRLYILQTEGICQNEFEYDLKFMVELTNQD